jgi:hypothetical protein
VTASKEAREVSHGGRTAVEIAAALIVIGGTLGACYWLARHVLLLPREIVGGVTAASGIGILFAAVYGYYVGWMRYHRPGPAGEASIATFRRRFRVTVFTSLVATPLVLGGISSFENLTAGALLLLIAAAVAPWAIRKIRVELRRET